MEEADSSREKDLLKWSRAEHCGIEDKEEERDDGKGSWECKIKLNEKKTWYFQVERPIWYPIQQKQNSENGVVYLMMLWGRYGMNEYYI